MPLNASGPISIGGSTVGQSINLEFGRASNAQTSMSQLYRNAGIVGSGAPNVPTSGPISLSQFYNAANRIAQTITISANQTNYVANTAKVTGYQAGLMDVTFVINAGVAISANSTGVWAFDVDTSWAAGDTVTVVNNGTIVGMGGAGGGGRSSISPVGSAGAGGGPAFRAQRATTVNNAGTIGGGGGGGGGGAQQFSTDSKNGYSWAPGGGGGGGGRSGAAANSAGGAGGQNNSSSSAPGTWTPASAGGTGTFASQGGGGAPGSNTLGGSGGAGGAGGGWGAAGATGVATSLQSGLGGGAAGAAVGGNSNITWTATGTRLGAIT